VGQERERKLERERERKLEGERERECQIESESESMYSRTFARIIHFFLCWVQVRSNAQNKTDWVGDVYGMRAV